MNKVECLLLTPSEGFCGLISIQLTESLLIVTPYRTLPKISFIINLLSVGIRIVNALELAG